MADDAQEYFIDTGVDREQNKVYDISVCQNGEELAVEQFYSKADALAWLAKNYPAAIEG